MKIITQSGDVITASDVHIQMGDPPKEGEDYVLNAKTAVGNVELFKHHHKPGNQASELLPKALHRSLVNLIKAGTEVIDIREIILQHHESNPQTGNLYRLATMNGTYAFVYAKNIDQAIEDLQSDNYPNREIVERNISPDRFDELWQMTNELAKHQPYPFT